MDIHMPARRGGDTDRSRGQSAKYQWLKARCRVQVVAGGEGRH